MGPRPRRQVPQSFLSDDGKRQEEDEILRIGYKKGWSTLDLPMLVAIGLVKDCNRSLVMDNNR